METLEQNQSLSSFYHKCCCCLMSDPSVKFLTLWWTLSKFGTMVQVSTTCCNKKCLKRENTWKSQPHMTGTLIPAGNFLLSFAILVAGGSPSKLLRIFRHGNGMYIFNHLFWSSTGNYQWEIQNAVILCIGLVKKLHNMVTRCSVIKHLSCSYFWFFILSLFLDQVISCNLLALEEPTKSNDV